MKILLSIKPEYAEKILSGEKRFEYRKALPTKKEINICVIYATQPVGKVIGEFEIEEFLSESPNSLWEKTKKFSGISKEFFHDYFLDRPVAHALSIKSTKRYNEPLEIKEILSSGLAPQSFCYIAA